MNLTRLLKCILLAGAFIVAPLSSPVKAGITGAPDDATVIIMAQAAGTWFMSNGTIIFSPNNPYIAPYIVQPYAPAYNQVLRILQSGSATQLPSTPIPPGYVYPVGGAAASGSTVVGGTTILGAPVWVVVAGGAVAFGTGYAIGTYIVAPIVFGDQSTPDPDSDPNAAPPGSMPAFF